MLHRTITNTSLQPYYGIATRGNVLGHLFYPLTPPTRTQVIGMASIALGMICVGSTNLMVTNLFIEMMIECGDNGKLENTYARFLALGIGLVYLGLSLTNLLTN